MPVLRPALSGTVDGTNTQTGGNPDSGIAFESGSAAVVNETLVCGGVMWIVNGIFACFLVGMFLSMLASPPPRRR